MYTFGKSSQFVFLSCFNPQVILSTLKRNMETKETSGQGERVRDPVRDCERLCVCTEVKPIESGFVQMRNYQEKVKISLPHGLAIYR